MTKIANDVRLFSVEQANRTLPLVSRIVADIVAEYPRWCDLVGRFELAAAGARLEDGESEAMRALHEAVDASAARIGAYLGELDQIGCRLKGFEQGLVDFHAMYQGRLVFLCWRRGEEVVTHWHEVDAGFAGRQAITPEFAAAVAEALT
jgi:hypothetical protein